MGRIRAQGMRLVSSRVHTGDREGREDEAASSQDSEEDTEIDHRDGCVIS